MGKKTKIEADAWYTLADLVKLKAFGWCSNDIRAYRNIVLADKKRDDVLKTAVLGSGMSRRYRFKGSNITRFIAHFESGKARM